MNCEHLSPPCSAADGWNLNGTPLCQGLGFCDSGLFQVLFHATAVADIHLHVTAQSMAGYRAKYDLAAPWAPAVSFSLVDTIPVERSHSLIHRAYLIVRTFEKFEP